MPRSRAQTLLGGSSSRAAGWLLALGVLAALAPSASLAASANEIPNERQMPLPRHALQPPAHGEARATATSLGPRTLREGMNGQDVAVIQARLNRRGYGLTADGDFGPKTRRTVIAFQRDHDLRATGVVGAATRAALKLRRQPASAPIKRLTTMSGSWLLSVPGTGGIRVDRRIRPDVESLIVYYNLAMTAGYATSGHATNGEHPLGLAMDAVPADGNWDRTRALAEDFGWRSSCGPEGCVDMLDKPFRFVGYDGYPGHGDPRHAGANAHIHLSWLHARTSPNTRAAWVDVFLP